METLVALFGTETKVRLLRLFLFNTTTPFLAKEITERTRCSASTLRKELTHLIRAGIVKKRIVTKDIESKSAKKLGVKKVKGIGYILDEKFPYMEPLKTLLTVSSLHVDENLARRFSSTGRIKLFVASGVFIQNWDSRVDLLIVGDELDLSKIEKVISNIEAEIGKEIAYSAFELSRWNVAGNRIT